MFLYCILNAHELKKIPHFYMTILICITYKQFNRILYISNNINIIYIIYIYIYIYKYLYINKILYTYIFNIYLFLY